jgi:hypothetical protein
MKSLCWNAPNKWCYIVWKWRMIFWLICCRKWQSKWTQLSFYHSHQIVPTWFFCLVEKCIYTAEYKKVIVWNWKKKKRGLRTISNVFLKEKRVQYSNLFVSICLEVKNKSLWLYVMLISFWLMFSFWNNRQTINFIWLISIVWFVHHLFSSLRIGNKQ